MQSTLLRREAHRNEPMIQCLQINKSYAQGCNVFKDANLEVCRGEFVFLLGHGGTGKSTLFRLLLGLELLDQGNILIQGRDLQRLHRKEIPFFRRCTGVVFQDLKLIQERTVFENVALPLEIVGREYFFIGKKVYKVLRRLGLERKMDMRCRDLSTGEQQRVAIARAIIHEPSLLLLDEPTASLDERDLEAVADLLESLHAQGSTIIVATHDPSLPAKVSESRVVTLQEGIFVENWF